MASINGASEIATVSAPASISIPAGVLTDTEITFVKSLPASARQEAVNLLLENHALKAKGEAKNTLSCKVGEKGGVSVYGLQRNPVTLYKEQWKRLIDFGKDVLTFIEANEGKLQSREETLEGYLKRTGKTLSLPRK